MNRLYELDLLHKMNRDEKPRVDEVVQRYASLKDGAGFLPVRGKVRDLTAIVDRATGSVLDVVPLNPWP